MELKCTHCGDPIRAENINIQEMVALCSACHRVFAFSRGAIARHAKHRKLKPPSHIRVRGDDDRLVLSYRFVFGSGPKFGLVMATLAAVVLSLLLVKAYASDEPTALLLFLGLLAMFYSYVATSVASTTTTITLDEEELEVKCGPLPLILKDDKVVSTPDISRVFAEQAYEPFPPFRTHNIYAELQDGEKIAIVTSLPRGHARYVAQTVDDFLRDDNIVGTEEPESGDDDDLELVVAVEDNVAQNHHQA